MRFGGGVCPGDVWRSSNLFQVHRLREKLAEQRDELRGAEARAMLAEESALKLSQEAAALKRALGARGNLTDGALDSQARLLHQLALAQVWKCGPVWVRGHMRSWGCAINNTD